MFPELLTNFAAVMDIVKVYSGNPDRRALARAADALRDGKLIVYPTDGCYAIGADALQARAVERLCHARSINPQKETLSIVCAGLSQASEYARIDNHAFGILRRHLPGAFTFVLPASPTLPKPFKGRRTVGIRVPDNDIAVAIAEELGHPIASATAKVGESEALPAIEDIEGEVALLVDGGELPGVPSTVVDITDSFNPEILRQSDAEFIP